MARKKFLSDNPFIALLILFGIGLFVTTSTNANVYSSFPPQPRAVEFYEDIALVLKPMFHSAEPFAYVTVDNIFPGDLLLSIVEEFPVYNSSSAEIAENWGISKINVQYNKVVSSPFSYGPATLFLMNHMKSKEFVHFLQMISGIPSLIPDPTDYGGGPHQILQGGHLGVHLDFNYHDQIHMWRRINVLLYLNQGWQEEWGGHLELWDADMHSVQKRLLPLFNRMVIFEATETSFHGHPDPLRCPHDVTRKSIAMYYYTVHDAPGPPREPRRTDYRPRPGGLDPFDETQETQIATKVF
mmetsp:Transcript_25250/g.42081  ORF Transcript_25250/g.42081 Transcript_25250/m.42081 type:complete len:298 (+) Transcript_25250:52-945(+)|eukprot:CAMPEP_0174965590 /NCGR_PEP_ID=MMETSP0004_2-20121128/6520_1 /TAXON_ID=420556 /ORGANISM="Ochromonas sp., Strain CCMP1393" /LENGTH=297 /DNA_ID=CAMNT_0016214443 /DNA_START=31 /DNA_END=924 /DNA_ORIENTATION=-